MKKQNSNDSQFLVIIHLILTISLLYFISASSGCGDDDPFKDSKSKTEVSVDEIVQAYAKAIHHKTLCDLKVDQVTSYELNQRVELGPIIKYLDVVRQITSITDDPQNSLRDINLKVSETSYDQYGEATERPTYDVPQRMKINCQKSDLSQLTHQFHEQYLNPNLFAGQAKSSEVIKVSFHNLRQSKPAKVPQKVREATELKFDVYSWTSDTTYDKTQVTWVISPDVPGFIGGMEIGFGGFLSQCELAIYGQYLVSTCNVLRNWQ